MHTVVHNVVRFVKKGGNGKRLKLFFVPPMENTLEAPLIYQLFNYFVQLSVSCREYL